MSKNQAAKTAPAATPADTGPADPTGSAAIERIAPTSGAMTVLGNNPAKPAIFERKSEKFAEGVIVVGENPWEHYAHAYDGAVVVGEAIGVVRRWGEDDAGEERAETVLVLRARGDVLCSTSLKNGEKATRGQEVVEKVNGVSKSYDRYTIKAGTLFAMNFRKILAPLLPFFQRDEACEVHIHIIGREPLKTDKSKAFWRMQRGFLPLGYARDKSLDLLSKQADEARELANGASDEIPFLWPARIRNPAICIKQLCNSSRSTKDYSLTSPSPRRRGGLWVRT